MYSRLLENLFYRPPRVAVLRRRVPMRSTLLPPRALNLRRGREAALHPHLGPQRRRLVEPRAHHHLCDLLQPHLRRVRHQPFHLRRDLLLLLLLRIAHVVGRAFRQAQARGLNPLPAILVRALLANLQLDRVRRDHRFRQFVLVLLRELKSRLRGVRLNRVMRLAHRILLLGRDRLRRFVLLIILREQRFRNLRRAHRLSVLVLRA